MRILRRIGVAAAVGAGALGLTGCGDSGSLLSAGAATQLKAELSQASTALADYNCTAATSALTNFRNDLAQLSGLNSTLTSMLDQGASTVSTLADRRCPSTPPVTTTTTASTTTTTPTHTHTAVTTTTVTEPPTTTAAPVITTVSTNTSGGAPAAPAGDTATTVTVTTTAPVPTSGGAGLNTGDGNGNGNGNGNGDGGD